MAEKSRISGVATITNNLMIAKSRYLAVVSEATERSAVSVSNDAKADHERGMAHADQRYENQTGTLTRSITPVLVKVDFDSIDAQVFSNVSYAPDVELGTGKRAAYPYLWPAAVANAELFKENMRLAISGL